MFGCKWSTREQDNIKGDGNGGKRAKSEMTLDAAAVQPWRSRLQSSSWAAHFEISQVELVRGFVVDAPPASIETLSMAISARIWSGFLETIKIQETMNRSVNEPTNPGFKIRFSAGSNLELSSLCQNKSTSSRKRVLGKHGGCGGFTTVEPRRLHTSPTPHWWLAPLDIYCIFDCLHRFEDLLARPPLTPGAQLQVTAQPYIQR
ncbi:hypothetical protein K438DRAFT_1766901 [Mycena galopus ATCC 62051]|nr:hypothetical protein K438DRAFT_1766901 [Mycena galopus ATCC 62051]